MMRTMAVWIGAVLMAGGLWSASVISQGLADEPAAPSSSHEATGGAAGNETVELAEAAPSLIFTQAVHFVAADGSDLVAEAGTYAVDTAVDSPVDSRIRLSADGRTPLLLDAGATTHREKIAAPLAVLVPGDDPDVLHVVLLLANGQALDAAGSLSGTRPRATKHQPAGAAGIRLAVAQAYVVQAPMVTVIDLNGRWTDGSTRSAAISAAGTALTIDMSAWGRPAANGSIVNGSTITVTFPDDKSYTGILQPPNTIRWSNGSAWAKVAQPAPTTGTTAPAPIVRRPREAATTTGTMKLPDRYTAPTANLTAVANALQLRHKSLTTEAFIPEVQVTQLVEISIGFYSATGHDRITQTLSVKQFGNRFLYNDPEGDGRPRQIRVDISLRELQPGGQHFSFSRLVDLDPLYDVAISPLTFTLLENCDLIGDSEIHFFWWPPEECPPSIPCGYDQTKLVYFATQTHKNNTINQFAWARSEVSASANLQTPDMFFYEDDPGIHFEPPVSNFTRRNLVPGKTKPFGSILYEGNGPSRIGGCMGSIYYTITYTLRWYPNL
jgi:hypothetical protein